MFGVSFFRAKYFQNGFFAVGGIEEVSESQIGVPTTSYRDPYSYHQKEDLKEKVEELKEEAEALEKSGAKVDVASLQNVGFLIKKLEVKEEYDYGAMYARINAMIDQYTDYLHALELRRIDDEEALFLLLN